MEAGSVGGGDEVSGIGQSLNIIKLTEMRK